MGTWERFVFNYLSNIQLGLVANITRDTIVTCSPLQWDSWVPRGVTPRFTPMHLHKSPFFKWPRGHSALPRKYPRMHPALSKKRSKSQHRAGRAQTHHPEADLWPELNQDDPLGVPQRVARYLSKQGRGALGSVHELASLITTCCVDMFDPHQVPDEFLFFDFFERSISRVVRYFDHQFFPQLI